MSRQQDIGKIYLYAKGPYKSKYQPLIKKREDSGIKHYNDLDDFMEYANSMNDVYDGINDCNPNRNQKVLIAFDDIIADLNTNKIFYSQIVKFKGLFNRCRKLNILLVFITKTSCSKRRQIKFFILPDDEDSQSKRTTKSCY